MTDLDALLAAIIATPDDDAARLVYADKYQDLDTEEARARAEFIRVQVELANSRKTRVDRGFLIVDDVSEDALRERERELLQITATDGELPFRLVWAGFDSYTTATGIDWIFSRGFIAEVRGPLAVLVGGETTRSVYERGEYGPNRYQETIRIPAVLPAIAQAHPLEWVRATDIRPWRDEYSRKFVWWRESGWSGRGINSHGNIPDLLFNIIASAYPENVLHHSGPPSHEHISFDSEHDALAALSHALIVWARKEQP